MRHCRNDQAVVMTLQTCTTDARMSQESHSYYTALFSCGSAMLLMKMMVWPLGSNVCALKLRHPGLPSPPTPLCTFWYLSPLSNYRDMEAKQHSSLTVSVMQLHNNHHTQNTHEIPIHLRRISEGCRKRAQLFALENTLKNIPKPTLPSAAGRAHWTAVKLEMLPGVMHRHRHKHRAAVSGGVTRVTL